MLTGLRADRGAADAAEARVLQGAVAWAAMHSADSLDAAATLHEHGRDTGVPVAGEGAPLVAEFSIAELSAALNLSTDAGLAFLGEAVELRYRLPRCWARVVAGDLVAWKARRIAKATLLLSPEAAAFVDAHVAYCAHRIGPVQLDRLVDEAIARRMPAEAERRRREASEGRYFEISPQVDSLAGTSEVRGMLDLADALDLDAAVTAEAAALKNLGSTDPLPVRRAAAVGVLARRHPTLALAPDDPDKTSDPGEPTRDTRGTRQVVLYVHLTDAAITSLSGAAGGSAVGRCENTRSPVTVEQIRSWCGHPDAVVTVKPVIDLTDHIRVDAYEVPGRIRETALLVDVTCVFPWCTRPARDCDCDHTHPHADGGPTCTDNVAPLCRRHHRLKTHGGWRYAVVERGSYRWTSPHGYTWLRDHTGTTYLTADAGAYDPGERRRRP